MLNLDLLIKRSIKSMASAIRIRTGFPAAVAGDVNILAYHRIVADLEKAENEAIYGIVLSAETFRKQCEVLKKSFDVVSLETASQLLGADCRSGRPFAVLTFDDGYLDFYETAFPILREFGFPATVFLPTEFVGQTKPLAHDRIYWLVKLLLEKNIAFTEPLIAAGISREYTGRITGSQNLLKITDSIVHLANELREKVIAALEETLGEDFESYPREYQLIDWKMVREMSHQGISFGGHTAHHVVLPLENQALMKTELLASRKTLEKEIGGAVTSFAYPNGKFNEQVMRWVREAGYTIAVTTETKINRMGAERLALGRISLCEESTRGITGAFSPGVADLRLGV